MDLFNNFQNFLKSVEIILKFRDSIVFNTNNDCFGSDKFLQNTKTAVLQHLRADVKKNIPI
jgi:hypothetical protein